MSTLEHIYGLHHREKRGEGFVLLGEERGTFLATHIGTGKRVLDIGCRDGALTRFFHTGNSVTGVDIDAQALARAKQTLGIQTEHLDLNGPWPLPPQSFDAVVAAEVIEHLYYPDVVLGKIATVLKPGGVLLGTVPNAFSLMHRLRYVLKRKKGTPLEDPTHINHFTVAELEGVLKKHFREVTVQGFGRFKTLARLFPQAFAFDLAFIARV